MISVIHQLRPKVFVAENVKGLLSCTLGRQALMDFENLSDYAVTWKVCVASRLGVPQKRERPIIIGIRGGTEFRFPLSCESVTAKEAIGDLETMTEDQAIKHIWSKAKRSPEQGSRTLKADRPATTMRAEHHGNVQWHYSLPRRISLREQARFQSFPDKFVFPCGMRETERQRRPAGYGMAYCAGYPQTGFLMNQAEFIQLRNPLWSNRRLRRRGMSLDTTPKFSNVEILQSLPGEGNTVLAILISEASDLLQRHDYQAIRCLSGVAPVTKRSGKKIQVVQRKAAQPHLVNAVYHWSRVAIQHDPVSRAKYKALRDRGHSHGRALRTVADRLLAVACAMLRDRTLFDPDRRKVVNASNVETPGDSASKSPAVPVLQ